MASHSDYAARQAALDAAMAPPVAGAKSPRRAARWGKATVGAFTGTWQALIRSQFTACLVDAAGETRCGTGTRRADVRVKPARSASPCARCANPAYCPDCGDTATTGHADVCIYGGQR